MITHQMLSLMISVAEETKIFHSASGKSEGAKKTIFPNVEKLVGKGFVYLKERFLYTAVY